MMLAKARNKELGAAAPVYYGIAWETFSIQVASRSATPSLPTVTESLSRQP